MAASSGRRVLLVKPAVAPGEDYLYPESYFVAITLPVAAQEALLVTN